MSDLMRWQVSDERLTEIIRGPASEQGAMATELRDLRAMRRADRDRIRAIVLAEVRDAIDAASFIDNIAERIDDAISTVIAGRVADQLATASADVTDVNRLKDGLRWARETILGLRTTDMFRLFRANLLAGIDELLHPVTDEAKP